ncbi:MAG: hypothetical protein JW909_09730 [Planctomycetes bacterium]|nr:hypothetical protein [Planctomycetota bacterium]
MTPLRTTPGGAKKGRLSMKIRYHCFKNFAEGYEAVGEREMYKLLQENPELRKDRYEMTSLCRDVVDDTLYFGCTHYAGDFLLALDLKTKKIRSCGYPEIYEENEHKIHRGLWYDGSDRSLVFATSTLSPISKLAYAPGGKFTRYHIDGGELEVLGQNRPGQYAQASVYDAARGLLYFFGYRAQSFGVFDVKERRIVRDIFVDSIPHIAALDDAGRCWSTYEHGHKWCCFDPEKMDYVFYEKAMESAGAAANVMYYGAGPIDSMINGGDGFMYVGTALGELYRLDPETADSEYVGRPTTHNRMPGICLGPDGLIYGAGGDRDVTHMVRYDRKKRSWEFLGHLEAEDGTKCYRPHDLMYHEGSFYLAETDVPNRSGYIWEIIL